MSKPIQFSEAALIGIHSLVLIANSKNNFLKANYIAEKTGSSKAHIAKVLQTLAKAGFVTSVRGPAGGFSIAKDFENISLLSIYEAIEGKITNSGKCPFDKSICAFNECLVGGIIHRLNAELIGFLKTKTLKDLVSSAIVKSDD
ncbi:MAG: Rrf2 family transcriptional regulator [Bacteroidales bacterium]|nr:Rrf2 family transcriptional regulator [Bacteroidales bacterium]